MLYANNIAYIQDAIQKRNNTKLIQTAKRVTVGTTKLQTKQTNKQTNKNQKKKNPKKVFISISNIPSFNE